MSRQPNHEQLEVIENFNGALLSAGAGSGKTFVIVEHLVKMIETKFSNTKSENLHQEIGDYLNKIVLMTFTKKASGEMLLRLINRLEEKIIESNEDKLWRYTLECVSKIKISTIHGFCHMLISEGYWVDYPISFELLNKTLHYNKINKIFNKWFLENKSQLPEQLLAHSSDLIKGLLNIFENPELRVMWKDQVVFEKLGPYLDNFFEEYLELKNFKLIFKEKVSMAYSSEQMSKQGFKLISDFNSLFHAKGKISSLNYENYFSLQESISRFPSATKDMSEIDKEYRLEIKELFDDFKKYKEDLIFFKKAFDDFKKWELVLKSAFDFVDRYYFSFPGLTFSDLEYYVYLGLRDNAIAKKIANKYQYIIVDEFQDTSPIQFEIIKAIADNNYDKLFCVGDKKQAIYGFRGGELKVFTESINNFGAERLFYLKSNYRSQNNVIKFNNEFFTHILPIGKEYEGEDPHSVSMELQVAPLEKNDGEVERVNIELSLVENEVDLDKIEAFGIYEKIKENVLDNSVGSIAVLYKKLSPSRILIDLLAKDNISFSAQVKIQIENDPIFIIFKTLVSYILNNKNAEKIEAVKVYLKSFFDILNVEFTDFSLLDLFEKNYKIIGLEASFLKFLFDLRISNSLYKENIELVFNIIKSCEGDMLKINQMIGDQGGNYSFELTNGKVKKVNILTVHTSKGLEYDCVILGGIHKNGKNEGLKEKVGKLPTSFKWKSSFLQKDYFKSPNYILESMIISEKDFSESKRLLYVACTRAVKKLIYVNLSNNGKDLSSFKNSWINAFRSFSSDSYKTTSLQLNLDQRTYNKTELHFKDQLGIIKTDNNQSMSLISELSVTRLATLVECPFKFYLKNICKIGNEFQTFENDDEDIFVSSMKRGSEIHKKLEAYIKKENNIKFNKKIDLTWIFSEIEKVRNDELISEREIKFSFMGHMITAIPDLVVKKLEHYEIWDFKTGSRDSEQESSYWFQLCVYAYGISILEGKDQDFDFVLRLAYVDEQKFEIKILKLKEILYLIKLEWKKIENFNQPNLKHCPACEYRTICKFAINVASA